MHPGLAGQLEDSVRLTLWRVLASQRLAKLIL